MIFNLACGHTVEILFSNENWLTVIHRPCRKCLVEAIKSRG